MDTATPHLLEVTDQSWQREALSSELPVIADFWAVWCPPCRQFTPIFEAFAKENAGKVKCVKVNTDECPGLSQQYHVQSIPTILFVQNGEVVGRNLGLHTLPQLRQLAAQYFKAPEGAPPA